MVILSLTGALGKRPANPGPDPGRGDPHPVGADQGRDRGADHRHQPARGPRAWKG